MNEETAIKIASKAAVQEGYDVRKYAILAKRVPGGWSIYYRKSDGGKPSPGDFFEILVDERENLVKRIVYGK